MACVDMANGKVFLFRATALLPQISTFVLTHIVIVSSFYRLLFIIFSVIKIKGRQRLIIVTTVKKRGVIPVAAVAPKGFA